MSICGLTGIYVLELFLGQASDVSCELITSWPKLPIWRTEKRVVLIWVVVTHKRRAEKTSQAQFRCSATFWCTSLSCRFKIFKLCCENFCTYIFTSNGCLLHGTIVVSYLIKEVYTSPTAEWLSFSDWLAHSVVTCDYTETAHFLPTQSIFTFHCRHTLSLGAVCEWERHTTQIQKY